ncbi:MurR/RpiR family transcriptional regulator [Mollicutes bacterium LVI A0039]|nr:MurR/RpiR family transcriptional regulator [Mollicutes bacterium LVI A0039]
MKNVHRQIMHHYKFLTKLEQIVADYFLETKASLPLRELAEIIHLSPATISRFVRKVGFTDYDDFLAAYESLIAKQDPHFEIDVYTQHLKIVEENYKRFQAANISEIVPGLIDKRVLIIAKEDTSFACQDFANRLKRLFIDATVAVTKQEMILATNFLKPGDVIFVVSISGYNSSIEEFLNSITEKNFTTIGVSTQATKMMTSCSQYIELFLDATSIMSFNFSYSLPLILLFDHLYVEIQQHLGNQQLKYKEQITNRIIS